MTHELTYRGPVPRTIRIDSAPDAHGDRTFAAHVLEVRPGDTVRVEAYVAGEVMADATLRPMFTCRPPLGADAAPAPTPEPTVSEDAAPVEAPDDATAAGRRRRRVPDTL